MSSMTEQNKTAYIFLILNVDTMNSYEYKNQPKSDEKCKRYSAFYPERARLPCFLVFIYRPALTSPIWRRRWHTAATRRSSQRVVYVCMLMMTMPQGSTLCPPRCYLTHRGYRGSSVITHSTDIIGGIHYAYSWISVLNQSPAIMKNVDHNWPISMKYI